MSQHIYLSKRPYRLEAELRAEQVASGMLEQAAHDAWLHEQLFNYRGEAGAVDDAHSFKRKMESAGHVVIIRDEPVAGAGRGKDIRYGDLI